ncbi:MAG: hypothetical protein A2Y17_04185 [Clostridiales bacterium GWF2_38_85]|nr:MAG: hypothetical protein A2Y17_04185 [Clostridiales bacterium GWF2_38_85]HBL83449.1 hypothetical protein [Clostridiales bacterium]
MNRLKLIYIIIFFILILTSCYQPSADISYYSSPSETSDEESHREIEQINVIDYNDDDLNLNWGYGCKLDGIVFSLYKGQIRFFENNELKKICRYPLCGHANENCASDTYYDFEFIATDGENIYCFGQHTVYNYEYIEDKLQGKIPEGKAYWDLMGVYKVSIKNQKIQMLDEWESTGIFASMLRINGDYIYYLKTESELKSDLYRVKKTGGKAEKVIKGNDSFISNIVFGEDKILFRKGLSYYITDFDNSFTELFTDERLAYIEFRGEYLYFALGGSKSYNCVNSDKSVGLHFATLYRIKTADLPDFTKAELLLEDISLPDRFLVTDNKVVYFPNEPVYLGDTTDHRGNVYETFNNSNGKLMIFDIPTFENKIVYSEIIGNPYFTYADDNQAFLTDYEKTYCLDLDTGELTELEVEEW